jgi:hypothetical protein
MTTMEGGKWNSSRIRETLEIVQEHLPRYAGKIVIFSEFLCTLDVLAVALHESGLEVLRFDGTVDSKDRETVVQKFEEDHDEARVLLVTSRSGGLGRSFTPADRVIHHTLLEPGFGRTGDRLRHTLTTKTSSPCGLHVRANINRSTGTRAPNHQARQGKELARSRR